MVMSKGWLIILLSGGSVFGLSLIIALIWQDGQNDRDRQNLLNDVREIQTQLAIIQPRLERFDTVQHTVTNGLTRFDTQQDLMKDLIHASDVRIARLEESQSMCRGYE